MPVAHCDRKNRLAAIQFLDHRGVFEIDGPVDDWGGMTFDDHVELLADHLGGDFDFAARIDSGDNAFVLGDGIVVAGKAILLGGQGVFRGVSDLDEHLGHHVVPLPIIGGDIIILVDLVAKEKHDGEIVLKRDTEGTNASVAAHWISEAPQSFRSCSVFLCFC